MRKFSSVEDLIRKTGVRRNELAVLAEIGALAPFGYDRRAALWQIEKAVRPEGELFELPNDDRRLTNRSIKSVNSSIVHRQCPPFPLPPSPRRVSRAAIVRS